VQAKDLSDLHAEFGRKKLLPAIQASVVEVQCNGELESEPTVLATSVLGEAEFDNLMIPERPSLLGEWFKAADTGFIYGKRGLGKSWLALAMARALVEGKKCGPWSASRACRVLYVDGEMSADDLRSRNHALREEQGELMFLSHQIVFDRTGKALCLSDPARQVELTRLCESKKIDVVILDNIACLFRGIEENSADDWRDQIENWLLDLRRRGIAVVIVAHAGRNTATMRGTSKREDAAFWILRLDEVSGGDGQDGAKFVTRFVKNRNAPNDPASLEWNIKPDEKRVLVTYREADNLTLFRHWIEDGLDTCSEIAEEMGLSKGQVSKLAKRAERAGWLKKAGRRYQLIAEL
jgi:AAA domain-containing protein